MGRSGQPQDYHVHFQFPDVCDEAELMCTDLTKENLLD